MARVSVTINGHAYQLACDDGQEASLVRLGSYVDKLVGQLAAAVGQVGDELLLVMASLKVADELSDSLAELEALRARRSGAEELSAANETLTSEIESLAERIENIAARLERP